MSDLGAGGGAVLDDGTAGGGGGLDGLANNGFTGCKHNRIMQMITIRTRMKHIPGKYCRQAPLKCHKLKSNRYKSICIVKI